MIVPRLTRTLQIAFWRFDDQGQVLKYHAWIPNLQAWVQAVMGIDPRIFSIPAVATICPQIRKQCKGPNRQYPNDITCNLDLQLKPFGSFDEAWGDNIACRTIHLILTRIRPDIHCPHVGPNGGSPPDNYKCVDIDYSKDYFDDTALFGGPEGDVFTCGGPLLFGEGIGSARDGT